MKKYLIPPIALSITIIVLGFIYVTIKNKNHIIKPVFKGMNTTTIADNFLINTSSIRIPILVYHSIRPHFLNEANSIKIYDVDPIIFEQQMHYLNTNNYTTINFYQLANYFKGQPLPTKPVVVSFDDGWENQFQNAYPILKKEKITATFFIYTNMIGHKKFMDWDQIKELANNNMEIGSHTKSHPKLWRITDQNQLENEIRDSKKIIERQLGKTVNTFAYPFGLYKPITVQAVQTAGYTSARIGFEGTMHDQNELYTLHSFAITNDMKRFEWILKNAK